MRTDSENASTDAGRAVDLFQEGGAYLDEGNFKAAARSFLQAVDQAPEFAEAHYNAGLAYQRLNRYDRAAACYRKALALRPDFFGALNNLGQVLSEAGDHAGAEAAYHRAMAADPASADPFFNLAKLAAVRSDWDAAISNYRKAIQICPEMVAAYNNLGNAFRKQKNYAAAAKCYQRVVSLEPDLAEGYYNLGSVLQLMEDFDAAIGNLKRSLKLKPGYKEALNNLALAYKNRGDLRRATRYFSDAIEVAPDFAEAYWNRSFTYLLSGQFEKGWADFEWRFRQPKWATLYPFRLNGPRWDGTVVSNQRILVYDEQGLGDTFQFVRYLPLVKDRCKTVVFETRRVLMPVLDGFPGIDELIERSGNGIPLAGYDFRVPLMSLPFIFQTTPETIPASVPYLAAEPDKRGAWENRLAGSGFKIGIVWAGRPQHMNDRNRSCRLSDFAPLAKLPGIKVYGLQKGPATSQVADWPIEGGFDNLGDAFGDFSDTAAAIASLDLIISVDTSVAHLAGAMGKPTWVLLPFVPDWRWMMHREDSPWYPTMRLFRQPERCNWHSVFSQIRRALRQMLQRHRKGAMSLEI